MTDLRSGLCHGPDCQAKITKADGSEDFCSDDCQAAWHALHALPPMPPLSIHLPGPATWTARTRYPQCTELCPGHAPDLDGGRDECGVPEPPGHWAQLDDSEYPDWAWRDVGSETWVPFGTGEHDGVAYEDYVRPLPPFEGTLLHLTKPAEVGEAATQPPTRRSWLGRFWRWMWLRG